MTKPRTKPPTYRWLSTLIALPAFQKAPALAVKVLLDIIRHRSPIDGLAFPGHGKIAERLGMKPGAASRRCVTRAAQWLVDHDLVTAERKWHKGRTRLVYRVPWLDRMQRSASAPTVAADQGSASAPSAEGAQVTDQGSAGATTDGAPALPPSEEGVEVGTEAGAGGEPSAATAADDVGVRPGSPDPEVLDKLDLAGINEPNRSKLATTPGITTDMVRRAAKLAKEKGLTKTGGVVVVLRGLLAEVENHRSETERRQSRQRHLDQETIKRREKARREQREAEEARDEVSRAATEYLATHGCDTHNGTTETNAEAGDDHPEVEAVGLCPTGGSSRPRRQHGPARSLSTTSLENSQ